MVDLQVINDNNLHINQYSYEHLTLDTNYASEYNKTNSSFTFYLDEHMRDIVELTLVEFVVMDLVNKNRSRMSISIEELGPTGFLHASGNRYQFVGEIVKTSLSQSYYYDNNLTEYPLINTAYFRPLNTFKCNVTVLDRLTIKFYDGVDELMKIGSDLVYANVVPDFSFWGTALIINMPSDYYLDAIIAQSTYVFFSDFTTSDPVTDAALITYMNDSTNKFQWIFTIGTQWFVFTDPTMPTPVGTPSNLTVNVIVKWKIQLQIRTQRLLINVFSHPVKK